MVISAAVSEAKSREANNRMDPAFHGHYFASEEV